MQTPSTSQPHSPSQGPSGFLPDPTLLVLDEFDRRVLEGQYKSSSWMAATVIEDDDLTFGGKPLSTWYEEERRSLEEERRRSLEEEQRRGRQRVRSHRHRHADGHHHDHGHGHHHHHHHHGHGYHTHESHGTPGTSKEGKQ